MMPFKNVPFHQNNKIKQIYTGIYMIKIKVIKLTKQAHQKIYEDISL